MTLLFSILLVPFISFAAGKTEQFEVPLKQGKVQITLGREGPAKEAAFIVSQSGKNIQTVKELGTHFADIKVADTSPKAIVFDFDQDGNHEFVVRTTQPPLIGSLWIFRWNGSKFLPVKNEQGDRYFPVPLENVVEWKEQKFQFSIGSEPKSYAWKNGKLTLQPWSTRACVSPTPNKHREYLHERPSYFP